MEEVVASFGERANHAEITLEVRADGRVELPLRPRMLRVVVENLLANAIRYAGPGTTCTVELSNPADGPVLTVSDDGKGVGAPTCRACSSASTGATRRARAAARASASRS